MNELLEPTSRRTLLRRGLVVLAGALGLRVAETRGEPAPPAAPETASAGGKRLCLYARQLRVQSHGQRPGQLPVWSGRHQSGCELFDRPEGRRVGEFSSTGFCPDATALASPQTVGRVELQTFRIGRDRLFGIGPGATGAGLEAAHAILGGTGLFAGARGTYIIRECRNRSGERQVEFVIDLLT